MLINTNEQMFTEKLRSLLKFGPASTRYKDIFDMFYLIEYIDRDKLQMCFNIYIYQDSRMRENNIDDIVKRLEMTFNNKMYQRSILTSDKKWIDENIDYIFKALIFFLNTLSYAKT